MHVCVLANFIHIAECITLATRNRWREELQGSEEKDDDAEQKPRNQANRVGSGGGH